MSADIDKLLQIVESDDTQGRRTEALRTLHTKLLHMTKEQYEKYRELFAFFRGTRAEPYGK